MTVATQGASARQTLGAVLGVVTETASVIGSVMQAGSGAAAMLNTYVNDARTKQNDRSKIEMHNYRKHLIEDSALKNSQRQLEILDTFKNNPQLKELFENEFESLNKIFEN